MVCSQDRLLAFASKMRNDAKRRAIAEEKRRWTIKYYTKNGKPDRKRRPGRPADKSILEAALKKITFSGGHDVDLTALNEGNVNSAVSGRLGSEESIKKAITQVTLQNYLNELHKYEQLMNPLSKIMEDNIAHASNEDSGWGPVGPQLHGAALNAGIVPFPPPAKQKRPLTADFQTLIEENRKHGTTYADQKALVVVSPSKTESVEEASLLLDDASSVSSLGYQNPGDGDFSNTNNYASKIKAIKLKSSLTQISETGKSAYERSKSAADASILDSLDVQDAKSTKEVSTTRQRWNRKYIDNDDGLQQNDGDKVEKPKKLAKGAPRKSAIPWALLDQLDGEKRKFDAEKEYVLLTKKF
jgi:hypothetical protein